MEHYSVRHEPDGQVWCVKLENNKSPIECFSDREEAIGFGRSLAQDSIFGRLTVHGCDGVIEIAWAFGSDPIG